MGALPRGVGISTLGNSWTVAIVVIVIVPTVEAGAFCGVGEYDGFFDRFLDGLFDGLFDRFFDRLGPVLPTLLG